MSDVKKTTQFLFKNDYHTQLGALAVFVAKAALSLDTQQLTLTFSVKFSLSDLDDFFPDSKKMDFTQFFQQAPKNPNQLDMFTTDGVPIPENPLLLSLKQLIDGEE